MTESESTKAYEELLEFVYVSPIALARIDESGAIDMMNSMGANFLLELSTTTELTNLFDLIDPVDPEVRGLVSAFADERGIICEGRRIAVERFDGEPLVLALNLLKLGPGRVMVALSDVSKLEAAHRAQRFLLDNVSDGLVTVDAAGLMSSQCSARMASWFGAPVEGETIWSYCGRKNEAFGRDLAFAWESLTEEVLPLELSIEQLPRRLNVGSTPIGVTYQPLMKGEKLTHLLVVMRDMTAELERERLDEEQRELMAAVSRLSTDREGFRTDVEEIAKLVTTVTGEVDVKGRDFARTLHTLKGNAALLGVTSVAKICHGIEDELVTTGEIASVSFAALKARWSHVEVQFQSLLGDGRERVSLTEAEYLELLDMLVRGKSRQQIFQKIESLTLAPLQSRFERFAEEAVLLGERLNKAPIDVKIEAHGLRHAPERLAGFWSAFVHAVRNAVDHGVESVEERGLTGKPRSATLELAATEVGTSLIVELRDDGRGIDWDKLGERAAAMGLPAASEADLVNAIFADGVSSADEITDVSGRGVGMGALKAECTSLGGSIEVESARGRGTTFRFRLPRTVLARSSAAASLRDAVTNPPSAA